jgi:hypothetical protein
MYFVLVYALPEYTFIRVTRLSWVHVCSGYTHFPSTHVSLVQAFPSNHVSALYTFPSECVSAINAFPLYTFVCGARVSRVHVCLLYMHFPVITCPIYTHFPSTCVSAINCFPLYTFVCGTRLSWVHVCGQGTPIIGGGGTMKSGEKAFMSVRAQRLFPLTWFQTKEKYIISRVT